MEFVLGVAYLLGLVLSCPMLWDAVGDILWDGYDDPDFLDTYRPLVVFSQSLLTLVAMIVWPITVVGLYVNRRYR